MRANNSIIFEFLLQLVKFDLVATQALEFSFQHFFLWQCNKVSMPKIEFSALNGIQSFQYFNWCESPLYHYFDLTVWHILTLYSGWEMLYSTLTSYNTWNEVQQGNYQQHNNIWVTMILGRERKIEIEHNDLCVTWTGSWSHSYNFFFLR